MVDKEQKGFILASELRAKLVGLGEKLTDQEGESAGNVHVHVILWLKMADLHVTSEVFCQVYVLQQEKDLSCSFALILLTCAEGERESERKSRKEMIWSQDLLLASNSPHLLCDRQMVVDSLLLH